MKKRTRLKSEDKDFRDMSWAEMLELLPKLESIDLDIEGQLRKAARDGQKEQDRHD